MMQQHWLQIGPLVAAIAAVTMTSATAEAAPGRPDWCGSYKSGDDNKAKWVDGYLKSEGWSDRVRQYVGAGACDKPDDAARQKDVEKWRSQYLAQFGGSPKDFSEMLAVYINRDEREKQQEAACKSLNTNGGGSARGEFDRMVGAQLRCGGDAPNDAILLYWSDRPGASELLRAFTIVSAFSDQDTFGTKYKSLALVLPEAAQPERLDRAKLEAELTANPRYNPYAKSRLRELHNRARRLAEVWRATAVAEPAARKVLIDAPLEALRAWESSYASHKEALDYAYAATAKIDADPSSAKGCSEKLRAYFASYVAEKKPADAEHAQALLNDYVGNPIVTALRLCEAIDGHPIASLAEGVALESKDGGRTLRGPRAAAYYGAVEAFSKATSDKTQLPFKNLPSLETDAERRFVKNLPPTEARYFGQRASGLVDTVTPTAAGTVKVTFKKEPVKTYLTDCFENRSSIRGFTSDGQIEYGWVCRPSDKFVITKQGEAPVVMPKEHAAVMASGRSVTFAVNQTSPDRTAFPLETYASKDKRVFLGYLGVSLPSAGATTPPATPSGSAPKATPKKPKPKKGAK